ncbi:MAG: hypothetical protein ACLP5H_31030 [Desulfomonilaceae bacterium]
MSTKTSKTKKRTGPEPKLHSLYPLKFQEGIDILVGKKPKKKAEKMLEEKEEQYSSEE